MRYVGLDFGEKRFGISLSDPLSFTAQSLTVIPAKLSELLKLLQDLLEKHEELVLVVGLPKTLRNKVSVSTQKVIDFVEKLRGEIAKLNLKVQIDTYDERFSTVASEKTLIEAGVSRQKRKRVIDSMAAAFMLQGYLDSLKK